MVVEMGGARCPCGRRGCMEAYAGRAAMEARARKQHEKDTSTDLFKLMKERGRTKLTSSVWARALEREDKLATELIDEAVEALGAGIASAHQPARREAVVIGGGLGVRLGEPLVEADPRRRCSPHLFNDGIPRMSCSRAWATSAGRWERRCSSSRRAVPAPAPAIASAAPADGSEASATASETPASP